MVVLNSVKKSNLVKLKSIVLLVISIIVFMLVCISSNANIELVVVDLCLSVAGLLSIVGVAYSVIQYQDA